MLGELSNTSESAACNHTFATEINLNSSPPRTLINDISWEDINIRNILTTLQSPDSSHHAPTSSSAAINVISNLMNDLLSNAVLQSIKQSEACRSRLYDFLSEQGMQKLEEEEKYGKSTPKSSFSTGKIHDEDPLITLFLSKLQNQLRTYVQRVSTYYNTVAFHSFDHCTHVLLSAIKIVSMMQESLEEKSSHVYNMSNDDGNNSPHNEQNFKNDENDLMMIVCNRLKNDVWLPFTLAFVALLHDIDHRGVSNAQLAAEKDPLADTYRDQSYLSSYAEQNSFDIGLRILDEQEFTFLKHVIYSNQIHNTIHDLVLCTDIASADRREKGMHQWLEVFESSTPIPNPTNGLDLSNLQNQSEQGHGNLTTFAIMSFMEQLIQAADVAHTMQSWDTFLLWNKRLYHELLSAYICGRTDVLGVNDSHPSGKWYESQIGFYDFYIIPLAKRLNYIGVFGGNIGETFANMANKNRNRWVEEGKEIVEKMIKEAEDLILPEPVPCFHNYVPLVNFSMDGPPQDISDGSLPMVFGSLNYDICQLIDPIVPRICAKQILKSLEKKVLKESFQKKHDLKKELDQYQKSGSIQRYDGALLFVDISGFTMLAQYFPLDDFKTFINEYFTKIIDLIDSFGGEVIKFAGDALYAIWCTEEADPNNKLSKDDLKVIQVTKCVACGVAINVECNDYLVSKGYSNRRSSTSYGSTQECKAIFERLESRLNVHCGVSEGNMAGVDLVAGQRAEFFLIGQPLKDVAIAEGLAKQGELVISPSVYNILNMHIKSSEESRFGSISKVFENIKFVLMDHNFCKLDSTTTISPHEVTSIFQTDKSSVKSSIRSLIDHFVSRHTYEEVDTNNGGSVLMISPSSGSLSSLDEPSKRQNSKLFHHYSSKLKTSIEELILYHSHEATRGISENLSAELRRVAIIFIKIFYEPIVTDATDDAVILNDFQAIFNVICDSIKPRNGQIRQFISDDKGTVCIVSFGLRRSVTSNIGETAINAARAIQEDLKSIINIKCSIGITLGKVFCGATGSPYRFEYSLLGQTVNLSARLMVKASEGTINCDEEIRTAYNGECSFKMNMLVVKGYDKLVPCHTLLNDGKKRNGSTKVSVRQTEIKSCLEYISSINTIYHSQESDSTSYQPQAILIAGQSGTGKSELISGLLQDDSIRQNYVVLQGNRCYQDSPFYCLIPIIKRILFECEEVVIRSIKMKKKMCKQRRLSVSGLPDYVEPKTTSIELNDLVPDDLVPYLELVNNFIFQGFPLFKASSECKTLKDEQKVSKSIDLLTQLFLRYFERSKMTALIYINRIDKADNYSKMLIERLFESNSKLIFMGSLNDMDLHKCEKTAVNIFGEKGSSSKILILDYLDETSTFDVFKYSLKDMTDSDKKLMSTPKNVTRIHRLSKGIPRFASELGNAVNMQWLKNFEKIPQEKADRESYFATLLDDVPVSKMEELIVFRFDMLKPEGQLLLKIASIPGIKQNTFSQELLETLLLSMSLSEHDTDNINSMFQGNNFESLLDYLMEQNYLEEIILDVDVMNIEDDSNYRFVSMDEQEVIYSLMLEEQKKICHSEIAKFYSRRLSPSDEHSFDDEQTVSTTLASNTPKIGWQTLHLMAFHFEYAGDTIKAMCLYYDSAMELARLAIRDRSHQVLVSSYLMLEKRLLEATATDILHISKRSNARRDICNKIVEMLGGNSLPVLMKSLTREHLTFIFENDEKNLVTCITMITKLGQLVGTIESDGYKLGPDLYFQAIFLTLLALTEEAFHHMSLKSSRFLDSIMKSNQSYMDGDDESPETSFHIDDLTVSFPAFSGMLTIYRDSPVPVDMRHEAFLAQLFVAFTEEMKEAVHVLRTKCILSHLYLKHGDVIRALKEAEEIKAMYRLDEHSLKLMQRYGMDWALICIGTMASVYMFRCDILASYTLIEFLEEQIPNLDEFASSTQAMIKQVLSSLYLIVLNFDKAHYWSQGFSLISYPYFYKPSALLQEKLCEKLYRLRSKPDAAYCPSNEDENGALSILSSNQVSTINQNRMMLYSSIESLLDRGIEAINAAICIAEIESLEHEVKDNDNSPKMKSILEKQLKYCEAGLAHLEQSLRQKDANSEERRRNYLACLYEKAELLYWYDKLNSRREKDSEQNVDSRLQPGSLYELTTSPIEAAILALKTCENLSKAHDYLFMLLLVGARYVSLDLDRDHGDSVVSFALKEIKSTRSEGDYNYAISFLSRLGVNYEDMTL